VRVVAVAKHSDVDQVRRRRILPDFDIDTLEIDLLVEPAADPVVTAIGDEVRKAADEFLVARLQSIAPDHLHRTLLERASRIRVISPAQPNPRTRHSALDRRGEECPRRGVFRSPTRLQTGIVEMDDRGTAVGGICANLVAQGAVICAPCQSFTSKIILYR